MPCNLFLLPSSPPQHIEAHEMKKKISVNFLKLLSTYIDFTFALTLMDRLCRRKFRLLFISKLAAAKKIEGNEG